MGTIFPWFYWLFPIAFALHNAEEALCLPSWSHSVGRYHRPVGRVEFSFAAGVLTIQAFAVTAGFSVGPQRGSFCCFFFVLNLAMLINVVFPHLVATVAMRRYAPGLATGLVLILPVTLRILLHGYTHNLFALPKLMKSLPREPTWPS